jgi:DNA-binding response OmpR family regulator
MATRILAGHGYQVCAAENGADAVRRAADPACTVDLLVTDMVMPGMLGIEVVTRVRATRPQLPVLFISGYAQQVLDFHGIPARDHDILQKPFTEAALLSRVCQALNRATIPAQRQSVPTGSAPATPLALSNPRPSPNRDRGRCSCATWRPRDASSYRPTTPTPLVAPVAPDPPHPRPPRGQAFDSRFRIVGSDY